MYEIAKKHLGAVGPMLDADKSGYCKKNPGHTVVYNANVVVEYPASNGVEKVWHGDLDVTAKGYALQALANEVKGKVHVLYEMDARFDTETDPDLENPVATFYPIPGADNGD